MNQATTDLAGRVVDDMERTHHISRLECDVCGNTNPGDWGMLRSGWPKCCGYTMRLITTEMQ